MAKPPVVLFIVPNKYTQAYTALVNKMSGEALDNLGKESDFVELVGFVSPNAEYGSVCLSFLSRSGVEPHNVLAILLLGEAGDQFGFHVSDTDDYVLGSIVVPGSLMSYPTLSLPSLETGWLTNTSQWQRIRTAYEGLLKNGRKELQGGEYHMFITRDRANWN